LFLFLSFNRWISHPSRFDLKLKNPVVPFFFVN
jgi:hypothetical protein